MVFEKVQSRFFQKSRVVLDLNFFCIGRLENINPAGGFHSDYVIRFKFWPWAKNANVTLGKVPAGMVKSANSPYFLEGMEIILPYITTSPGYQLLQNYPILRLADLERRKDELELELLRRVQQAKGLQTIAQYREAIEDILDLFESYKIKTSRMPETPITMPAFDKSKERMI